MEFLPLHLNQFNQEIGASLEAWTPRPLPARATLNGSFCTLEPINPRLHAEALWSAYRNAEDDRDWTYLPSSRPENRPAFDRYLETLDASTDPLHFAVIDTKTNKAVGSAALMRIDPKNGVLEIGHINWSPLLRRQRTGTEAIYRLLEHAFDHLGYRRCEWKCDSLNEPSRKAAARYGFRHEGIFRQAVVYKGRNRDTAWYSIIDSEWPVLRTAFQSWLAVDNFDENGHQKRKLEEFMPPPASLAFS